MHLSRSPEATWTRRTPATRPRRSSRGQALIHSEELSTDCWSIGHRRPYLPHGAGMSASMDGARALASRQHGLITMHQFSDLGFGRGQVAHLISSAQSRAVLPGIYLLDAKLHEPDWAHLPLRTRVQAALLFHGSEAVICLSTAGRLLRVQGVGGDTGIVHVLLPPGRERHQVRGIRVHTRLLDPKDVQIVDGVPVTSARRTVLDLVLGFASDMRTGIRLRREAAVQVLDSALNRRLLGAQDLELLQTEGRGRRGAAIAKPWWELADERAESPNETSVRLIAIDAKLPPDELQLPVRDNHGILLGRGDLAWRLLRGRWLVAEADGAGPHGTPEAVYRDRFRANDFAATGKIILIRFTYADTRRPSYIVSQLRLHLC